MMSQRPNVVSWAIGLAVVAAAAVAGWAVVRRAAATADPLGRAAVAYEEGRWDAAAALARERLVRRKDDAAALRILARSSARVGRDASALALYKRLGGSALTAEDHTLLGAVFDRAGKTDDARRAWEAALKLDPDRPEALEGLCRLYTQRHGVDEAVHLAERLSKVKGWETRGRLMLGVLRVDLNDPAGSAEALAAALARPGKGDDTVPDEALPRLRKLLARNLLRLGGRGAEARALLDDVVRAGADREASWLLSRACLELGDADGASKALAAAGSYRAEHPLEPEPSPYAGEARCQRCHAGIAQAMATTRHARTFHRGEGLKALPLPDGPVADPGDPAVRHTVERQGERVEMTTRVDGQLYRNIIDYAFGTTDGYVTMTGRDPEGTPRAARLSYHRRPGDVGWDVTSGDVVRPDGPDGFRGRSIETRDGVIRCLACHTTNVRFGTERTGPESADRGIGCENCHGPSALHVKAVESKLPDLAVVNPAHAPEDATATTCAGCHTLDESLTELTTPREDVAWVRSPGKTLTWSRCYTESRGALRCLTCHEAHRPSETSPAFYEPKCQGCHPAAKAADAPADEARGPACPVSPKADCLRCHMPKVPMPLLHTGLTDHYIRVRKPAAGERPAGF